MTTHLSVRQREVLALVADGQTTVQIAARLGVHRRTVDIYLQRTFARLDAHSRAQAVACAFRAGLLS